MDTKIVATCEVWQGKKAIEVGLIDALSTSDDYLVRLSKKLKLFEIEYVEKKNLTERFAISTQLLIEKSIFKFYCLIVFSKFCKT